MQRKAKKLFKCLAALPTSKQLSYITSILTEWLGETLARRRFIADLLVHCLERKPLGNLEFSPLDLLPSVDCQIGGRVVAVPLQLGDSKIALSGVSALYRPCLRESKTPKTKGWAKTFGSMIKQIRMHFGSPYDQKTSTMATYLATPWSQYLRGTSQMTPRSWVCHISQRLSCATCDKLTIPQRSPHMG